MAPSSRTTLRRRLGVLVAGAAVATVLTTATAAAAPPGPMAAPAAGPTPPAADPSPATATPPPGFLLDRGQFTPVTLPPGQEDLAPFGIGPIDLNDRRQIVGSYDDVVADATRGFLLDRGRFTTVHVPGAMSSQAQGINNRGQIVGVYSDDSNAISAADATRRGFLLDRGRYLRLDVPGARKSQAYDINDGGQVVGEYLDANGAFHGYVWQWGRFRPIDVPRQPGTRRHRDQQPRPDHRTCRSRPARIGFLLDRGRFTTFWSPAPRSPSPSASTTRARSWATASAVLPPPRRSRGSCAMPGGGSARSTGPAPPSPRPSTSTTAARSWVSPATPSSRPRGAAKPPIRVRDTRMPRAIYRPLVTPRCQPVPWSRAVAACMPSPLSDTRLPIAVAGRPRIHPDPVFDVTAIPRSTDRCRCWMPRSSRPPDQVCRTCWKAEELRIIDV